MATRCPILRWHVQLAGANLLSLVCVPIAEAGTASLSDTHLQAAQSKASGDTLNNMVLSWVSRPTTKSTVGPFQDLKIRPGAPVVVSFDLDSFSVGMIASDQIGQAFVGSGSSTSMLSAMTDSTANMSQGYGLLREGEEEDTGMLHVEFPRSDEGTYFANADVPGVRLLFETQAREGIPYGGFYCAVHPARVMAHATFRNMFVTDTLDTLRWHMAVLFPEPLEITDVTFSDASGQAIPEGDARLWQGYAWGQLMRGEVSVEVCGRKVLVLDPHNVA